MSTSRFLSRPSSRASVLKASLALVIACGVAHAQDGKKNPGSKMFVSDVSGEAQIDTGESIQELAKKAVYTAQGTVIETKKSDKPEDKGKIFSAMVFSNGTGAYFEEDTRVEVRKFVQEPFTPNRVADGEVEPSISQTDAFVSHGTVGLCTSKLVAGSQMRYQTPLAQLNIRGNKVVIQASDNETKIAMLAGDSTVRTGAGDVGGQVLHSGQEAIITPGVNGGPNVIKIQDIPSSEMGALTDKVDTACKAKKTVYFEVKQQKTSDAQSNAFSETNTNQGGKSGGSNSTVFTEIENSSVSGANTGGNDIVAVPTVPTETPVKFTVSPAVITSGG